MRIYTGLILLTLISILSCRQSSDTIRIVHAGSLTIPVREIVDSYTSIHPGKKVLTEAWGSRAGARRISDLEVPCDVFISADYKVIKDILIPGHASWYIPFAGNEMSIVYNTRSLYADEITGDNWWEILLRDDVKFGRSDPNSDPCGLRAVMTIRLSGLYYDKSELAEQLLSRHYNMIRPKETDLLALLEENIIDYAFIYRSIAVQHELEFIILPDEVNLKDPELNHWYANASTEISGSRPGETILEFGEAMIYGITIPHRSENPEMAHDFVDFFLSRSEGLEILERNGQNTFVPHFSETYNDIPDQLKQFALKERE